MCWLASCDDRGSGGCCENSKGMRPMPKQSRYARRMARLEAEQAAPVLEEPVTLSFFAGGGGRRGLATAIIAPLVGGSLGEMAAQGAGELGSHVAEAATEAVERIAEAAKKGKADEKHAYGGSKFIWVKYRKRYYIAMSASKVGIFRPRGVIRFRGMEPMVIIPRGAIRNVEFHRGFWSFVVSCLQVYPLGPQFHKLTITLDDGGRLHFWVLRWGKIARGISAGITALFPRSDSGK